MFHQGEASVMRYHKALLLMEGLSLLLTEQDDILSVSKCKCVCQLISDKVGMSPLSTSTYHAIFLQLKIILYDYILKTICYFNFQNVPSIQ